MLRTLKGLIYMALQQGQLQVVPESPALEGTSRQRKGSHSSPEELAGVACWVPESGKGWV